MKSLKWLFILISMVQLSIGTALAEMENHHLIDEIVSLSFFQDFDFIDIDQQGNSRFFYYLDHAEEPIGILFKVDETRSNEGVATLGINIRDKYFSKSFFRSSLKVDMKDPQSTHAAMEEFVFSMSQKIHTAYDIQNNIARFQKNMIQFSIFVLLSAAIFTVGYGIVSKHPQAGIHVLIGIVLITAISYGLAIYLPEHERRELEELREKLRAEF